MRLTSISVLLLLAGCGSALEEQVDTTGFGLGTYSEITNFGSNPGEIRAYKYVPENMPANAPLVLALHACSQTAADYRRAGWEALADRLKFYVVYPEQQTANNGLRCFNWAGEFGNPLNLTRGEGENQSTKQIIDKMMADHSIDPRRIFAMGHSGGAAQVNLLLATWPDLFAGGGSIAGIPYNCTTTFTQVATCLSPGINRSAMEWGDRARAGHSGFSGPYPKLTIWHGNNDTTVATMNLTEQLEQWTNVHGIDMIADATNTVDGATKKEYRNAAGATLVETYEIPNMGHGTPVVPGSGCGQTGTYFLNAGICAVEKMAEFWGLDSTPMPGDTTAPVVNLTSPSAGATLRGMVTLEASASDAVGVTRVEFFAGSTSLGTDDTSPYSVSWNAAAVPAGDYTLRVTASDAAGNVGQDADTTVHVDSTVTDMTAPVVNVTAPSAGAMVSGLVEIRVDATDNFAVTSVEVTVDGNSVAMLTTAPYIFTWDATAAGEGNHTIAARASDAAGNTATDDDTTVVVTAGMVMDTTPPIANITSPAAMSTISGIVTVKVDASDETMVQVVLLFIDDDLIGSDYRPPYEFLFDTAGTTEGPHRLVARAFDAAGNIAIDDDTEITVSRAPPGEEPPNTETERVSVGKRYWGCSTSPAPSDLALLWILAGIIAIASRRMGRR